jgi:oligoribonuclease NrnB/cAMP/cGMP phosphodiesterase (DHH superfamily)
MYHIFHHNDEDGISSAAVIYEYLKARNKKLGSKPIFQFYEIDYTVKLDSILPEDKIRETDELFFVDYSFSNPHNLEYMEHLADSAIAITWIDHHLTSKNIIDSIDWKKKYIDRGIIDAYIRTDYCATWIAYYYAYMNINNIPHDTINWYKFESIYYPLYIQYVDSWDTWKHNKNYTTEFNYGMRSIWHGPKNTFSLIFNHNSRLLNSLFCMNEKSKDRMLKFLTEIAAKGRIIMDYVNETNKTLVKNLSFKCKIRDHINYKEYSVLCCNSKGNSTLFGDLINDYDIVCLFTFNGCIYVYSLYTNKEYVNCEEIAKLLASVDGLGGGGHAKAAGFQTYNELLSDGCVVNIKRHLFSKKYKVSVDMPYILN